jgi:hypothetical protein
MTCGGCVRRIAKAIRRQPERQDRGAVVKALATDWRSARLP